MRQMTAIEETIRALALEHDDVTESVACKGTALESITFNRGSKAFLFLGKKGGFHVVRLKLLRSEDEAKKLAKKEPGRYDVGANGWAKLTLGEDSAPAKLLEKWVDESYRAMGDPLPKKSAPAVKVTKKKKR